MVQETSGLAWHEQVFTRVRLKSNLDSGPFWWRHLAKCLEDGHSIIGIRQSFAQTIAVLIPNGSEKNVKLLRNRLDSICAK